MQTSHDEGLRGQFVAQQRMVIEPDLGADDRTVARNRHRVFGDSVGNCANLLQHRESTSVIYNVVGVNGMPELRARFAQPGGGASGFGFDDASITVNVGGFWPTDFPSRMFLPTFDAVDRAPFAHCQRERREALPDGLAPDRPTLGSGFPSAPLCGFVRHRSSPDVQVCWCFEAVAWHGFFVPAATPKPIVEKLSTEIRAFMQQPETVQKLAELGAVAVALEPDAFAAYIASETARWKKVIEAANIKMD
jgi:hypothetical protein